jgi:aspartate/methionine/tyrosine aminotransferase
MLPSPAAIEGALDKGVKLIYLESPSRLTGSAYDAAAVTALAELLTRYDAAAIVDQGLAPWVAGYAALGAAPGMVDRVIVLGECWPGVGLENLAIGYAGVKPAWLEPMRSQKQIMAICTSTVSQYAAVAGAEVYGATHAGQRAELAAARDAAVQAAEAQGATVLPGGAVSLLALHGPALAQKLTAAGLHFADGADFGAAGIVRLAVAADGTTAQALG